MTWVLGSGVPFGYGALIADVRASWGADVCLDRLQKIYPVGPGLMAGFAGSVAVGFSMIGFMQRRCCAPPGTLYPVKRIAWHWHRFARWLWTEAVKPELKPLGCELMIVGVSPEQNGPFLFSNAVKMKAPEFNLEIVKAWTWGSIGDGASHAAVADYTNIDTFWDVWARGEISSPGGAAFAAAHSVARDLETRPMASVSPILQIGVVRADSHVVKNLRRERHGAWSAATEADPEPGELITSWTEFREAAQSLGLQASAAVT